MRILILTRNRRHIYNAFRRFCTKAFYLTNSEFDEIICKYVLLVYAENREQALVNITNHFKKLGLH